MKVGTKSVLFGTHAFWLHPFFVARGWYLLYGWTWDLRIWVSFFVHDLGYIGKPNMDGVEGEAHVLFGGYVMWRLFDTPNSFHWHNFTIYHSRFWAKHDDRPPSRLCYADKMAFCIIPWWLYRTLGNASGEIHEYMSSAANNGKYASMQIYSKDQRTWFLNGRAWMLRWIGEQIGATT